MDRDYIHKFWRNPDIEVNPDYKRFVDICRQEFYLKLKPISKMWLRVFKKYAKKSDSILELGCSVGRNLCYLKKYGFKNLKGVEINENAPQFSRENYGEDISNLIEISTIEDWLTKNKEEYDVVFTSGVLMHIHYDSDWIFEKMVKIAKTYIFIAEVESDPAKYKFPRNYKEVFEKLGMVQLEEKIAMELSPATTLRIFKNGKDT